jgi:DDE superfamily endonuclease
MSRTGWQAYAYSQDEAARLLFPPVHGNDQHSAAAQVQAVCYRSPLLYGLPRSRWSLALLRKAIAWLADKSLSCISQLLKRLHVSYKRGRLAVHSPDLLYDLKLARIRAAYQQMQQDPTRVVLLYLDEHLVGRYPTVARCYSSTGAPGMRASQYAGYNSMLRIVGCLDAASGAVLAKRYGSVTVPNFLKFLQLVEQQYPDAEVIYLALDNWTVHVNERVLPALQARQSKIQLLFQPTYAPWTNPMEKGWLRFNEDVSHMHPHWAKWQPWRLRIDDWIAQVRPPSQAMLQATGVPTLFYLTPPALTQVNF